jgi:hypothetical protein
VQLCVYVTSLIDSLEDDEHNVEYEPLIVQLLASGGSSAGVTTGGGGDTKSMLCENVLATLGAASKIDEAISTDHIEPFLSKSTDKRSTMMPQSLQVKRPQSVDHPLMFGVIPREVYLSQDVPQDSIRYLLITIVTAKNVIFPSVKVFAKPLKGADSRIWHFSKKKVNNSVLLVGDPTDIVYIEVCTESPVDFHRRTCAGFATAPMINLQSGAMGVKPGTFFRPSVVTVEEESSSSCFCFSSTPTTRIVVDVKKMSWDAADGDIVHRQTRVVLFERHAKMIRTIHDFLSRLALTSSPSRAIRWQFSQLLFSFNEKHQMCLDQLCDMWEGIERKLPKEIRSDAAVMDVRFAEFVSRFFAVTSVQDEQQQLSREWGEKVTQTVMFEKQLPEVNRAHVAPMFI